MESMNDFFSLLSSDSCRLLDLLFRFCINTVFTITIARAFYFPKSRRKDFFFTYVLVGFGIFMLIHLMGDAKLKTGIARLQSKKEIIDENDIKDNPELVKVVKKAKENPGIAEVKMTNNGNDFINIVNENGYVWKKWLVCTHVTPDGTNVEMPLYLESDGTRRLIEYMPLLYAITRQNKVYIVDEIERSIHPIMIKDLMRKLSESETATGQLIFTTHESSLLDQSIFRPDEIWFAQKDVEQATQLYPLSDFNIHKTANIENGYLNGRYGGIPFLSNLKDLHW